ncbi:MAG: TMEM165/GDT1 family protein [Deltaproteobacteria bacterium]|nr:TMEM165/GDT1 family protein [Deltaproteobacteria bacterium]
MTAFWASLAFVVLAEMGDKTQLLAMALATRFKVKVVMGGILMATAANHFLAVVLGNYITDIIPIRTVQIAAAASFVLFGLWTIRGDELEGEDKRFNFSPFWTVFVAFFLAEMGDKTQLATVAMAAKYQSIVPVWIGTTTAMIIADALGIVVGITLGKKIPERAVKWIAAMIFIFYGILGLYEYLPKQVALPVVTGTLLAIMPAVYLLARGNKKGMPISDTGDDRELSETR